MTLKLLVPYLTLIVPVLNFQYNDGAFQIYNNPNGS